MAVRVSPATITALSLAYLVKFWLPLASVISMRTFFGLVSSKINMFIYMCSNSHECPMLMAVSTLSPVSTQSCTPARLMSKIVLPTSSCSLSSMAVEPTRSNSTSSSSATLLIAFSLFKDVEATWYFFYHAWYVSSLSVLDAIKSVRRPVLA